MTHGINWSLHYKYPRDSITCRCGAVYRSHAKGISRNGTFTVATELPCPGCGSDIDHVRAASSEPERVTITARDAQEFK